MALLEFCKWHRYSASHVFTQCRVKPLEAVSCCRTISNLFNQSSSHRFCNPGVRTCDTSKGHTYVHFSKNKTHTLVKYYQISGTSHDQAASLELNVFRQWSVYTLMSVEIVPNFIITVSMVTLLRARRADLHFYKCVLYLCVD